jgi:hypothetical protein
MRLSSMERARNLSLEAAASLRIGSNAATCEWGALLFWRTDIAIEVLRKSVE